MHRNLTNQEFDVYIGRILHDYLCQLERDIFTDNDMFLYHVEKLVYLWKEIFYAETNKRIGQVRPEDFDHVAAVIAELWYNQTSKIPYVDSRVNITQEELNNLCSKAINEFYIIPPDVHDTCFMN